MVDQIKLHQIIAARNHAFESMIVAQKMMDYAETDGDKVVASSIYSANWAAYQMLVELERRERAKK